jgi:hypothetical protein
MPAHFSHLYHPLDVAVFSPLKKAYGKPIKKRSQIWYHIIHKYHFLMIFSSHLYRGI